jgi:hypothetical protein
MTFNPLAAPINGAGCLYLQWKTGRRQDAGTADRAGL